MSRGPAAPQRLELISDFNVELLARLLSSSPAPPAVAAEAAPFNQVAQSLATLGAAQDLAASGLVWARAEGISSGFARALDGEPVDADEVLAEVDAFAARVGAYAAGRRHVFVVPWRRPPGHRGYGLLDWRPGLGLALLVARMNQRLAERLAPATNVFVLDLLEGAVESGGRVDAPKMWYAAKVPYGNAALQRAASDLKDALLCVEGRGRRLVVLDLDDTLWGGVVGETGWEGLRLGGHDHVGEAYVAFQRALKALTQRGVQLAVVSKNDEPVALEAIDRHPEMLLRRADLAGWRINWQDKAANIVELAEELGLGLSSLVFVDDNPAERGRVREALPEVLVPDWPADPAEYARALGALTCFDVPALTAEDRARKAMYVAERERRSSRQEAGGLDEWLARLDVRVEVEPLGPGVLARAAQLFNKTNQLNLSTRRMTEAEIAAWCAGDGRRSFAVSVGDRFGPLGLTGVLTLELVGAEVWVRDLILSCRAMGRRVEETLLHLAVAEARELGASRLLARHLPTERNAPCLRFLEGSGLAQPEAGLFAWDCHDPYPLPRGITLLGARPAAQGSA